MCTLSTDLMEIRGITPGPVRRRKRKSQVAAVSVIAVFFSFYVFCAILVNKDDKNTLCLINRIHVVSLNNS